ncbi:MAG: hypothetical protein Q4D23_12135, partial [Bacteroidales bacterium]|nr:hypothetical protein [Bacteroidales bacterium]
TDVRLSCHSCGTTKIFDAVPYFFGVVHNFFAANHRFLMRNRRYAVADGRTFMGRKCQFVQKTNKKRAKISALPNFFVTLRQNL